MNDALAHKCPNCNAVLKYNPKDENWKCEYCHGVFNIEEVTEYNKKIGNTLDKPSKSKDLDMYVCSNCGAKIIADENTSTTSCVYCKNTAILKDKLTGEFSPEYLIPFKKTKEDAIDAFKALRKGRPFIPKEFLKKENINEMSGIYIPFWIYDCKASGNITASCNRVTTWRSGDYRYTKTDTYKVTRGGTVNFEKIPTDGSKRFPNDIMNSIEPFDYKDLKDFNFSYLSGFLSEKYDVSKEEASEDSIRRAKESFEETMRNDIRGYASVNVTGRDINLSDSLSRYVLLPVWMLNIKYKDKIYTFAMNGQTGKMIGDIPINKFKAIMTWIIIFLITFGISFLIGYMRVNS